MYPKTKDSKRHKWVANTLSALIVLFLFGLFNTAFAASSPSMELVSVNFSGNTNGIFNPGGSFGLIAAVTAYNQTALNASVTLSSLDACVSISQATASYGNVPVSQNVDNTSSPFAFSISSSCAPGHLINLTLTLNATGYSSSPIIVPILVAVPSVPYITPPYSCSTNYYVSTNGSNANDGTTPATPWLTISYAISVLKAQGGTHGGVCVNVQPGTYNEYNYVSGLSGSSDTPTGYLVFRSMMQYGATIQIPAANASNASDNDFRFDQEHFIVVDGFNLVGQVIPGSVESGVVSNAYGGPGDHMKIINNILANHGGAGVGAVHTDYLVVEGNIVFGNANTSSYEVSGISTWQAVASDTAPGYHNIISQNIVFNNAEVSDGYATHTDGNGIIIDDFRNTQNNSTYGIYAPQTLVQDNLVFGNGGAGIHLFLSNNVTVLNNTTMGNAQDPIGLGTWRSEINTVNGANNTFVNNIAVAVQATNIWNASNVSLMDNSTNGSNLNNLWYNNLTFNGTVGKKSTMISGSPSSITSAQGNILGQDPNFLNPSLMEYTLEAGSPAILAGTNTYGYPLQDLAGNLLSGNTMDMGAYQYSNLTSYPLTITNAGNGFGMVYGSTTNLGNLINCGINIGATFCSAALNSTSTYILTAASATGSVFSGWTVTGSFTGTCTGTTNPCTLSISAATTVTANFLPQTSIVSASAGTGGTISPSGSFNVNYGTDQDFTLTPNTGYTASLTVDGNPVTLTNNTFTLPAVTAPHTVVASFTLQTNTVNVSAGTGGTISPSGAVIVNYGTDQDFTLTPNTGYTASLTVDGNPVTLTNNTFTLPAVTAPHTVVASFTLQTNTVNVSAGTGGTISPSGAVIVNYGTDQDFTLTPNTGYTASLTVDGNPVTLTNNTFTLPAVTAPHTVVASFTLQTNTVTVSAGTGGTISPSGAVIVNYGTDQDFTLTPNTGYTASLTVDGNPVTLSNNTFTLPAVTAAHTVVANFIPIQTVTINAGFGGGGIIIPYGNINVVSGNSQTFTLKCSTGYNIANLTVDGKIVPLVGDTYTLDNVTTYHKIKVNFSKQVIIPSASISG